MIIANNNTHFCEKMADATSKSESMSPAEAFEHVEKRMGYKLSKQNAYKSKAVL